MHDIFNHGVIGNFLATKSGMVCFVADMNGKILQGNHVAETLLQKNPKGSLFEHVLLDFNSTFSLSDCLKEADKKHLFHLNIPDSTPRSFLFSFLASDDHLLIVGESDSEEAEVLKRQLLTNNQELNNLTRALHKKNAENQKLIDELKGALDEIKTLQGIIPICMHCKQIRDDKGFWNRLEAYIEDHSEAQFSHSICEKCLDEYYPEDED